jgi:hypothetical protein
VAAARDVEAERSTHIVIGRERQQLLQERVEMERTIHVFEKDEKLAGPAVGMFDLCHDHRKRVVGLRGEHGDVGEAVALQKNVDGLHVGTLLIGCPMIGIEPLKG